MYQFEKKGIKFSFRNPKWNEFHKKLYMEWKVEGVRESNKNDGYFYNSGFLPDKGAMELTDVKISGQNILGVTLPENVLSEVRALYDKLREEDFQKQLNSDIKYELNDTTAYGIYNGISELDISTIVGYIKKQYNSNVLLFADDIAKMLTKDEELQQIAIETYQPYPERDNWNDQYLIWHRKAAKEKKAPGYGIIPNEVIKQKITDILLEKMNKENKKQQKEQERIDSLFARAKETGKEQLISQWSEGCNNPKEECNLDIVCKWAMPDGTIKITRDHTW